MNQKHRLVKAINLKLNLICSLLNAKIIISF